MHYSSYPYPDPEAYLKDNRKISDYRVKTVPTRETWDQWFPGKPYRALRVLVAACGTVESLMVAGTNRDHQVIGIDASKPSLDVATRLMHAEGVKNLSLYHGDVVSAGFGELFDVIIATGILHHLPDVVPFLTRLRELAADDGRLVVMVYGNYVRSFIPGFCQALDKLGLGPDPEGVAGAKAIIGALPEDHLVKDFDAALAKVDSNTADTWLHDYFRHYSASEFIGTVERYRFTFRQWLGDKEVATTVIDALPPEFHYLRDRFYRLSAADRWDVCQVFNQHDVRMTALFAAR